MAIINVQYICALHIRAVFAHIFAKVIYTHNRRTDRFTTMFVELHSETGKNSAASKCSALNSASAHIQFNFEHVEWTEWFVMVTFYSQNDNIFIATLAPHPYNHTGRPRHRRSSTFFQFSNNSKLNTRCSGMMTLPCAQNHIESLCIINFINQLNAYLLATFYFQFEDKTNDERNFMAK